MSETIWLRRPRYSLLDLSAFLLLGGATIAGGMFWQLNRLSKVLRGLPLESFDIIYVDGSHVTADALEDAVLSWRLLKIGGLLIFDDYQFAGRATYNKGEPFGFPKPAIDAFVQSFQERCEVIHNEFQLILRKTRQ